MKDSAEYERFTAIVDRVLSIPHGVRKQRIEEEGKRSAQNPNRPGHQHDGDTSQDGTGEDQRTHESGLRQAVRNGKTLGQPRKAVDMTEIRRLQAEGMKLTAIADVSGVNLRTIMRRLAE